MEDPHSEAETTRIVVETKELWDRAEKNVRDEAEKIMQSRLTMLDADDPTGKNLALKREIKIRVQNVSLPSILAMTLIFQIAKS